MLLAEPRKRVLPLMPAGRVPAPVIGLTGAAAKAALDAKPGAAVKFGRVSLDRAPKARRRRRGSGSAGSGSAGGGSAGGGSAGGGSAAATGPRRSRRAGPHSAAPPSQT